MVFNDLADVDRQMMEQATETVMVENVESDFKFMTWRSPASWSWKCDR
jgi:hypothetical protein